MVTAQGCRVQHPPALLPQQTVPALSNLFAKHPVCAFIQARTPASPTLFETSTSQFNIMTYNVYTLERIGGGSRNHVAIFVETGPDKGGRLFHVTGNILSGMVYETRECGNPTEEVSYIPDSIALIGTIDRESMPPFEAACEAVEVPGPQLNLRGSRTDISKPIRRCGEWVHEVKEKLIADGIVKP